MSFLGVEFWFFLPPLLALYWLLPRRAAVQNGLLLAASYLFFASWHPHLTAILAVSTLVDHAAARYIERQRRLAYVRGDDVEPEAAPLRRMRLALAGSALYGVGQLLYCKYLGFFAASANALLESLGLGAPLPVLQLILPLGISFWTLQKLGYLIDVYHGRITACRSLLQFATFVAFFPQLAAGPIPRGKDLLPQLARARQLTPDDLAEGAGQFFLGFFKKAFVADFIAMRLVDPVFADPGQYSTAGHWLALIGYAVQVFMDFSGYSDMAIGCGRLFGIRLPRNFNFPFLATTLTDFWRRWHITLNNWLFEYIYGPLVTGTGRMRERYDLGFLLVFLISGLWHGALWTFVVWGLLHGLGLIAHRRWDAHYRGLCRKDRRYVALRRRRSYLLASWATTQLFFLLTLVPFRASSLGHAGEFARGLLPGHTGALLPASQVSFGTPLLLVAFALFLGYHAAELSRGALLRRFLALPPVARGAVYGVAIAFLMTFLPLASGTFIYATF
jgi:alginate O-acetyltransferase complex protein AlgI